MIDDEVKTLLVSAVSLYLYQKGKHTCMPEGQIQDEDYELFGRLVKAMTADEPHVTLLDSGEPWTCPKCGGHLVHRFQSGCYTIMDEVDLLSSTYDEIGDLIDIDGDDCDCDEYRCARWDEDVDRPEEDE